MDKIFVEIFLPVAGKSYDAIIPGNILIGEIVPLLASCLGDLEEGYFIPDKNSLLCDGITGVILDVNLTPYEMGIVNGTRLMLI